MLNLVLYQNGQSLFSSFQAYQGNERAITVCPSPSIADDFRGSALSCQSHAAESVTTYSQFLNSLFEVTNQSDLQERVATKSQLMMILGMTWKKFFNHKKPQAFFDIFEKLTDLRSYSTHSMVIQEFLSFFDEDTQKALLAFNSTLEEMGILDEHQSANTLSTELREVEPLEFKEKFQGVSSVVIFGFTFLSTEQINLLKALSLHLDVFIPLPESVYSQSLYYDWPQWGEWDDVVTLPAKANSNPKILSYKKGQLNSLLSKEIKEERKRDILLVTKNLDSSHLLPIPMNSTTRLKMPVDILGGARENFFLELEEERKKWGESVSYEEFKSWLEKRKETFGSSKVDKRDFRGLKVVELWLESLEDFKNQSDILTSEITELDFLILEEVTSLKQPRVFLTQLHNSFSSIGSRILGFKEKTLPLDGEDSLLIASSNYSLDSSRIENYPAELVKVLSGMGPIKRTEFEDSLLRAKIDDVLACGGKLILEEGLSESSLFWNRFLVERDIKENEKFERELIPRRDFSLPIQKQSERRTYSASRLQTYIDCPRKYWASYLRPGQPEVLSKHLMSPQEMGEILHDFLAYFWEEGELNYNNLVSKFDLWLEKHKKELNLLSYKKALNEIFLGVTNVKSFLDSLHSFFPSSKFIFEDELPQENRKGRVDLRVLIDDDSLIIIDFKRGKSSVATYTEVQSYEKVQIPYYLSSFPLPQSQKIMWGYLCFNDIGSSYLATNDSEWAKSLSALMKPLDIRVRKEEHTPEFLDKFNSLHDEIVECLRNEELYQAKPAKPQVCTFCPIRLICDKGVTG